MKTTLDIFETNEFVRCLHEVRRKIYCKLPMPRKQNPFDRMREKGLLSWKPFVAEYCRCIEKKSALPAAERQWLLCIGDCALKRTIDILETKETNHGKKQTDNIGRAD
ncbi:MAG: hypothetical protein MdMp024_0520 [Bacteroidales bacterium]